MSESANTGVDVGSIVERLTERAARVDADDLGGLAQMHGLCETLVQAAESADTAGAPLSEKAKSLTRDLERLILGEVENAADGVAAVVEQISVLAVMAAAGTAGCTEPPTEACEAPVQPDATGDVVRDKLAKVFDDDEDEPEAVPAGPGADIAPAADTPAENAATASAAVESGTADQPAYEQTPLSINPKEIDFVKGFVEESLEHISSIEIAVLEVERTPGDTVKLNDLFRPFHTIKGMAGFLNLRDINCLAHEAETLLDQARKGQRTVTPGLIDLIFDVVDILKAQIASISAYLVSPGTDPVPQPPIVEMISRLRAVVAGRIQAEAREQGGAPGAAQRVGENLVAQGTVAPEVVDFAVEVSRTRADGARTGEVLMDMGVATARQVSQALRPQAQAAAPAAGAGTASVADQSVRIDTAKLDALVDMVGELVIAQTLVSGNASILSDAKLSKDVSQVTKIVRTVQEVVLSMRMIPIGSTFQKMGRLVRDVARKAGKQVELTISGEETELDKNVIQQISDPLIHMVRNAVDHGVEDPEARRAAGKNPVGRVHLNASHQGGNIVIEISDDGKGLDPQKLLAKGIERGLVPPGAELTNEQIFALIFAPGFSTAEVVTDISGRGVGMDVVRRNIEQLRGKVDITSEKGKGTCFLIRLPLTLAIIDGMVVRVAGERFIIPTITLEQALRPVPEQLTTVQHRGEMISVRGKLIPLLQLGQLFGLTRRVNPCDAMVVIANSETDQVGLVVEELLGQQQVVIKSLGERFRHLRGISGGAILGDGRVGLILEMTGLAAYNAATVLTDRVDHARTPAPSGPVEQPVSSDEAPQAASEVVLN